MHFYTYFLLALTVLNSFAPTGAFVSYRLLVGPDNRRILLYGDVHRQDCDLFNVRDIQNFFEVHELVNNGQPSDKIKPAHAFFENDVSTFEYYCKHLKGPAEKVIAKTFDMLMTYLAPTGGIFKNIYFTPLEPRGMDSNIVNAVLDYNDQNIRLQIAKEPEQLFAHEQLGRIKRLARTFEGPTSTFAVRDYKAALDRNGILLQQWITQAMSAAEKAILIEHSERYSGAKRSIEQYLAKADPAMRFDIALFNLLDTCKTNGQAANIIAHLHTLCIYDLDYLFADAGFLHALLQDQRSNTRTLLMCGELHAAHLAVLLKRLGYVTAFEQTILHQYGNDVSIIECSPFFSKASIVAYFCFMDTDTTQRLCDTAWGKKIVQLGTEHAKALRICGICHTSETDEKPLQRCSICKAVLYCSRTCQAADWAQHKQVCSLMAPYQK